MCNGFSELVLVVLDHDTCNSNSSPNLMPHVLAFVSQVLNGKCKVGQSKTKITDIDDAVMVGHYPDNTMKRTACSADNTGLIDLIFVEGLGRKDQL